MNEPLIQLQGNREQVSDLKDMLIGYKGVLLSLGGNELDVDIAIEKRLQRACGWIEQCEMRLGQ